MSILNNIYEITEWEKFHAHLTDEENIYFDRQAISTCEKVIAGKIIVTLEFPKIQSQVLKKYRNSKPRTVYYYPEPFQTYLKFINWQVLKNHKYIKKFNNSCLAYIPGRSVRNAVSTVRHELKHNPYYYKTDFSDYFNTIDPTIMEHKLEEFFNDDEPLAEFFKYIISKAPHGVGAGLATAGLCANIYMNEVDHLMRDRKIHYYRYADDVLILGKSESALLENVKLFEEEITKLKIGFNIKKTKIGKDELVFLGVKINKHEINISEKAMAKIKSSMSRRQKWFNYNRDVEKKWNNRSRPTYLYIRGINRKLYASDERDETGWIQWYGGLVSTDNDFKKLEAYLLKQISKLYGKKDYEAFKKMGYKSLVHEYYNYKKRGKKNDNVQNQ